MELGQEDVCIYIYVYTCIYIYKTLTYTYRCVSGLTLSLGVTAPYSSWHSLTHLYSHPEII